MKTTLLAVVTALSVTQAASADSSKSIKRELHAINQKLNLLGKISHTQVKMAPKLITQKQVHEAGGTLILTSPGDYCLEENICGTLVLDADSICLDLCCHTLNAHEHPHAIIAHGHQGIKVFDGRIINSTNAAILVEDSSAVELFKLVLSDNAMDGIRITDSQDLNVHDIDCIGDTRGERALWFDTCENITVNHVNASGYLSTLGAIVQLDSCNAALIQDVDVVNNTKSAAFGGSFDISTMFVGANTCTGVDLVHVKVNNNTISTTGSPRFSGIGFIFSDSCTLNECQVNSNNIAANIDGELYRMVFIGRSSNFTITKCQANSNTGGVMLGDLRGFSPLDSSNLVFDGCQVNKNHTDASDPSANAGILGIFLQNTDVLPAEPNIIRNCQVNFNRIDDGGAGRIDTEGVIAGIVVQRSAIVDHCQSSNNSIGTADVIQYVEGLIAYGLPGATTSSVENVIISNCSFNNNTGGELGIGIVIDPFSSDGDVASIANITISNCSASSNGTYGISAGKFFQLPPDDSLLRNIEITDSICNKNGNGSLTPDAAGIFIDGVGVLTVEDTVSNILIKNCQVYDTASTLSANGIRVRRANNVVIENTNVFNTTADGGQAHGILFDNVTNSKILRTQVHGNQNNGVELVGDNSNIMILNSIAIDNDKGFSVARDSSLTAAIIQGNRALDNTSVGFEHATLSPQPFDTAYLNNYAQNNGVNYSISNYIQVVDYSIPTAVYTLEPNGATDFPTLANVSAT